MALKDQIEKDNEAVFLDMDDFGEMHELNGDSCKCILQGDSVVQELSIGAGERNTYPIVYGADLTVNVQTKDLYEVPVYGQTFKVDDTCYLVDSVKEDMGMLTIGLVANDR